MSDPVVRTASRADRDRLVETLAAAFGADPVVSWMIGVDRMTTRRARHFFSALTGHALRRGWCDLALAEDGGAWGAAVWYPPGGDVTGLAAARQLPGLLAALGPRLGEAGRADRLMHARRPAEPHWYLQFIGVRPEHTGAGLGGALLAHRLAQIDAEARPAYLESSNARNMTLYERNGFELVGELRLDQAGPAETLMLRPSRR